MDGVDPSNWDAPLNQSCDSDPHNEPSDREDSSNMSYHDDSSDDDSTEYEPKHKLLDDIRRVCLSHEWIKCRKSLG